MTPFLQIFSYIMHIFSTYEALRIKIWVFCTIKTILILNGFNQFLVGNCAIIGYQLLQLLSNGSFYEIYTHFTNIFLHFAYLVSFWDTQGQNMIILYHQTYFDLLQSTHTRTRNCLIVLVKAVFMKSAHFLHIFSYILHIL